MPAHRVGGLPGERYGGLVVIEEAPKKGTRRYVRCRCDCGNETVARLSHIRSGQIKACGCQVEARKLTHGMSGTPEYRSWCHMIDRCCNPRCTDYQNWGGRGITICDEWRGNFVFFYEHIGPRPSEAHTVDRIDNERGYEPGNVRWATRKEQARNMRVNTLLELDGKVLPIAAWAETLGINPRTLMTRLVRGWGTERALTQAVKKVGQSWRS